MLNQITQLIPILGIVIIIILLLIILLVLLSIRKRQALMLDSADVAIKSIEGLQESVIQMDAAITGSFSKLDSKTLLIDSKQISIKDSIDGISKAISDSIAKAKNDLANKKRANKDRRRVQTPPGNNPKTPY